MVKDWEKSMECGTSNQEMRNKANEKAGVAILVSNRMSKYLIAADPEGSRLMRVRLKSRKMLDILAAYGQEANKTPKGTDGF